MKKKSLQNLDRVKVNAFDAVEELKKIAEDFETRILPVKGGGKVRKRAESREGRKLGQTKIAVLVVRAFSELPAASMASLSYPY